MFLEQVKEPFKNTAEMFDNYNKNFCKLSTDKENAIQQSVFNILKNIKDYDSFHTFIKVPKISVLDMDVKLKQAVLNSKTKKYHGTIDEMNILPEYSVQIKVYQSNLPKLEDIYLVTQTKSNDKLFQTEIKELKTGLKDADWKQMCSDRWEWVHAELYWNASMTADQVCELANSRTYLGHSGPKERLH